MWQGALYGVKFQTLIINRLNTTVYQSRYKGRATEPSAHHSPQSTGHARRTPPNHDIRLLFPILWSSVFSPCSNLLHGAFHQLQGSPESPRSPPWQTLYAVMIFPTSIPKQKKRFPSILWSRTEIQPAPGDHPGHPPNGYNPLLWFPALFSSNTNTSLVSLHMVLNYILCLHSHHQL